MLESVAINRSLGKNSYYPLICGPYSEPNLLVNQSFLASVHIEHLYNKEGLSFYECSS